MEKWTEKDSHELFLKIQELCLSGGLDQAKNPQWVKNFTLTLLKGGLAYYNQTPENKR
jgi:hypothetical protein